MGRYNYYYYKRHRQNNNQQQQKQQTQAIGEEIERNLEQQVENQDNSGQQVQQKNKKGILDILVIL